MKITLTSDDGTVLGIWEMTDADAAAEFDRRGGPSAARRAVPAMACWIVDRALPVTEVE